MDITMKIRDFRIDKYEDGYLAHGWLSADSFEFNGNSEQYVYIEVENIKKAEHDYYSKFKILRRYHQNQSH